VLGNEAFFIFGFLVFGLHMLKFWLLAERASKAPSSELTPEAILSGTSIAL